jgi:hypothetical protein
MCTHVDKGNELNRAYHIVPARILRVSQANYIIKLRHISVCYLNKALVRSKGG